MQKKQRRFAEPPRRGGIAPARARLQLAERGLDRHPHLRARTMTLHARISRASACNPLALFVSKGVPSRVSSGGRTCHDSNTAPHSHFCNATTGELFDFDYHNLQIRGLPSPPDGTVTEGVEGGVRIRPR